MNASGRQPATLAFGPFRLDTRARRLTEAGRPVVIGDRALDLLIALTERPGEVLPKADLMSRVWPDTHVEEANLRVQIAAIRRALGGEGGGDAYIANAPGRGYRFVAAVDRQTRHGASIERRPPWSSLQAPIGREDEIAAIVERIRKTRLLTIVGPGGIGKTTLALACAKGLAARHADGVAFAEVSGGVDPAMAVAASLGLRLPDENGAAALAASVAPLDLLVVLDACEFAIGASARLAEAILREAPNAVVLATSREPLRAEVEVVWRIGPLATPPHDQRLSAARVVDYAAARLFVDRASAADRSFRLTDEGVSTVVNICRRLDGLPLAIELAAGRIGAFGLEGIEAGLDDRFQMLRQGRRTAMPRHQTMAAAVGWSYESLTPEEQWGLQAISLFQGTFDAAAAADLALDGLAAPGSIYDVLSGLVAKSLVVADTTSAPVEYRLLDTTREYARLELEAAGRLAQVAARHAAWTITVLASADSQLGARSMLDWLEYFGGKLDDVASALDWACSAAGDRSLAVPLTLAAIPIWLRMAWHEECKRRIVAALAVADPGSRDEMALTGGLAGAMQGLTADLDEAVAPCLRAISLAKRFQDPQAQLRSEWMLWSAHINGGKPRAALADAASFSELAGRHGGAFEAVIADRMASITELMAGNLSMARPAIDRLLARPTTAARDRLAWYAYEPDVLARNTLVTLLWLEGRPDSALAAANQNFARALAAGHNDVTAAVLTDALCLLAHYLGDLETAERRLAYLEMLVRQSVGTVFRHWPPIFRTMLAAARGDAAPGLALLDAGLPAYARHPRFAAVLVELALGLGKAGALGPARDLADQLLRRCEDSGEWWIWGEVQRVRGELCEDDEAARSLFQTAIDTAGRQGARAWGLRAATSLARRQPARARELLAPWLDGLTEGRRTPDVVVARSVLQAPRPTGAMH